VIEEQLATVRRYDRAEAAQRLNIPETWLKRWVTARCVPHQRSGNPDGVQQRGVWFTLTDILAIGRMLPGLMRPRQKKRAATANGTRAVSGVPGPPTEAVVDGWAHLGIRRDLEAGRRVEDLRPAAATGAMWQWAVTARPVLCQFMSCRPERTGAASSRPSPGERGRERSGCPA
jgi:hypothetical protein